MRKLIKDDPIMAVILILILVTIIFIAHNCIFMWFHYPLDQITYDYWTKTQMFLGVTLATEVIGGFGYGAYKHKIKKSISNDQNILEESEEINK